MDMTALKAHAHRVLADADIPELPGHYRGKVRDNYDLPDGRRIIIASDRLSAFDRILATIPFKGQVLTQTERFWFEATGDICPNHVRSEEHTSELQSIMRNSYAVFCLNKQRNINKQWKHSL